ncbi:non-ribosomal peptide synthase/polyketide synthase [Pseudoalteromonas sp. PS5]|uniref:non-ribosomal peptide synthetase n=1 Tax=Pseudoalteromonas sp. PS5 TaxID=1437473 RepID=UPI000FFEF06B|nr:non-ribosomal peptide synthase/polyketide synthase [Pseudoalteromonas sp. PS5]RXF01555.1 amino acid adenylation domain-containing protein [Pseudoalteromonas sp. PS5]
MNNNSKTSMQLSTAARWFESQAKRGFRSAIPASENTQHSANHEHTHYVADVSSLLSATEASASSTLLTAFIAYLARLTLHSEQVLAVQAAPLSQQIALFNIDFTSDFSQAIRECETTLASAAPVSNEALSQMAQQHELESHAGCAAFTQLGFASCSQSAEVNLSQMAILLCLRHTESGYSCEMSFATALYSEAIAHSLFSGFLGFLEAATSTPQAPLNTLALVGEQAETLLELGQPSYQAKAEISDLVSVFRARVAAHPQQIAVREEALHLTYEQLDKRSEQLAHILQGLGVSSGDTVAVALPRSVALVETCLAIVKLGAAYVPIALNTPIERLTLLHEQCQFAALVCGESFTLRVPDVAVINLDKTALSEAAIEPVISELDPSTRACILYTSGSTGKPKGVILKHGGLNRIALNLEHVDTDQSSVVAFCNNTAFDACSFEMWLALLNGASLAVISQEQVQDPRRFGNALTQHGVTHSFLTVALVNLYVQVDPSILCGLEALWFGGEVIPVETCRRLLQHSFSGKLIACYGPTENSVFSTTHLLDELALEQNSVALGRACAYSNHYVLDPQGQLLPLGVTGELYLAGDGLAEGYLAAPTLTEQAFVSDPFNLGTMYRSGDLVWMDEHAVLHFVGRADNQVKIRGHRIEPEEVQVQLGQHPDIAQSHVRVMTRNGQKYLAAFICFTNTTTLSAERRAELLSWLAERLPPYMLPSSITQVSGFTLNANGKIDKAALPEPSAADRGEQSEYIAPQGELEAAMATLWQTVLEVKVGRTDNFYHLGGDSIAAMKLVHHAYLHGFELDPACISRHPRLHEMAVHLQPLRNVELQAACATGKKLASAAQQRMYFMQQLDPHSVAYNLGVTLTSQTPIDAKRLAVAVNELIHQHEVLTQGFAYDGKLWRETRRFDGVTEHACTSEQDVNTQLHLLNQQVYDLNTDCLFRVALLTHNNSATLYIGAHHSIVDGWSLDIILRTLHSLYHGAEHNEEARAFDDYCQLEQQWLTSEQAELSTDFWSRYLAEHNPSSALPFDFAKKADHKARAAVHKQVISNDINLRVTELAKRWQLTPFNVFLSAFYAQLGYQNGERQLTLGTAVAGREWGGFADTVGMFVNTLALNFSVDLSNSFQAICKQVGTENQQAFAQQQLPYERVQHSISGSESLFNVMFDMQNAITWGGNSEGNWSSTRMRVDDPQFDLTVTLESQHDGLNIICEYDASLYQEATIVRFISAYRELIGRACEHPEQPLYELMALTSQEQQLVDNYASVRANSYPHQHYLDAFDASVAEFADAIAVQDSHTTLTYTQLDQQACALARALVEAGVKLEQPVAVHLARGHKVLVAMLAIAKAGGSYLPFDMRLPAQRIRSLIEDQSIEFVISDSEGPFTGVTVVDSDAVGCDTIELTQIPRFAAQLAYTLFTSGTTGKPKGAMTTHQGMVNHNYALLDELSFSTSDCFVQTAALSFDISVWQHLAPLMCGARVAILSDQEVLDPLLFLQALAHYNASVLQVVPAQLQQLIDQAAQLAHDPLAALRILIPTGEALPPSLARTWFDNYSIPMFNAYGPAECSDDVTLHHLSVAPPAHQSVLPIGKPITECGVYLLDEALQPVPVGAIGEICIAGEVVLGRGYLNAPALTANAFVANPFGAPGSRMYKTGDLGRFNFAGELEFVGRRDFQIKIRGMRIEIGEIESVMEMAPNTARCIVCAEQGLLLAYLESELSVDTLRLHAQEQLPEHMVPSYFVVMDNLPVTANGKVDRKALPTLAQVRTTEVGESPCGEIELYLAKQYAQLLDLEVSQVYRDAHFFRLGGHSLLAMKLISALRKHYSLNEKATVKAIFDYPNLSELATFVAQSTIAPGEVLAQVTLADNQHFALTQTQQQMLWFEKLQPGTALYNMPNAWQIHGELESAKLEAAVTFLQRKHPMLRARIDEAHNLQFISEHNQPLTVTQVPKTTSMSQAVKLIAKQPFDLSAGLFEPILLCWPSGEQVLVFNMHHLISDAWSSQVMLADLMAFYSNQPVQDTSSYHYADLVNWQQQASYQQEVQEAVSWWCDYLHDAPHVSALPTAQKRPPQRTFQGQTWSFSLSSEASSAVAELAQDAEVSLFTLLLSCYTAYMSLLTGAEQLITGVPVAGRDRTEFDEVVGLFVNTLPFKAQCQPELSFTAYLAKTQQQWLEILAHQQAPLEAIIDGLGVERSAGINPLVQLMFNFEQGGASQTFGGLTCTEIVTDHDTAKFDCLLSMSYDGQLCQGSFELPSDLYHDAQAQALVNGFAYFVEQVVQDADKPLAAIPLIDTAQQQQVLKLGQSLVSPQHTSCDLISSFMSSATAYPQRIAVREGDKTLSYQALDRVTNQLAHYLIESGVQAGGNVAIVMPRSMDWILAAVAIIKTGAAYVPIDPRWPQERIHFVLQQANINIAFAEQSLSEQVSSLSLPTLLPQLNDYAITAPIKSVTADSVANIIYTSGSTGQPKGVVTPHRGITRLVLNPAEGGLDSHCVVSFMNNPAFDGATFEIWSALLSGGCLAVVTEQQVLAPTEFAKVVEQTGINYGFMTVALFNQYVKTEPRMLHSYRRLWIGGEAVSSPSCKALLESGFKGKLCNGYGPTENTIFSVTCEITLAMVQGTDVPLGHACAWGSHLILNAAGQLVPLGTPGELCLAGEGLAHGYLARPELTAQAFIQNPYGEGNLYRSGDQVYMAADGTIHFLGRIDNQVKIRGHRIEPEELKNQLDQHPDIENSVVVVKQRGELAYLAAYIKVTPQAQINRGSVLTWLKSRVAHYLLPSTVTLVEQFTLTHNGKVDARALPEPTEADWGKVIDDMPLTQQQQKLAAIWHKLLKVTPTAKDNFFALGGNSILLMQLVSEVKMALATDLSIAELFMAQTLEEQAELLTQAERSQVAAISTPESFSQASPAQTRMYFMQQLEPTSTAYNINLVAECAALDAKQLQQALIALSDMHPVLCQRFEEQAGVIQRIAGNPCQLEVVELDSDDQHEVERYAAQCVSKAFDLACDCPLRVTLINSQSRHFIALSAHHIALDGWSLNKLFNDLAVAYEGGELAVAEPFALDYNDYCYQQTNWMQSAEAQAQRAFWQAYLEQANEGVSLPVDHQKRPERNPVAAYYDINLEASVVAQIEQLASRYAVTPFNLYLCAFSLALSHASGERDLVIGTVSAGRTQSGFEQTLGMFVNTLSYRQRYSPQMRFVDLIKQSGHEFGAMMANQMLPYDEVMSALSRGGQSPLFNVMFDLQNSFSSDSLQLAGQPLTLLDLPADQPQFDMTVVLESLPQGTRLRFEYDATLYEPETIARFAHKYLTLLQQASAKPEQVIAEFELLDQGDNSIWHDFATLPATQHRNAHYLDVFDEVVAQYGDKIAVDDGQRSLTYRELDSEANRLAAVLLQQDAVADHPVAVHLTRSCHVMIAMLAIFKAGGCYLPLDTRLPTERIRMLLDEHHIKQVITDRAGPFDDVCVVHPNDRATQNVDLSAVVRHPEQLAYVLFTSGTTGKPKGAMTTHQGMVNHNWAALDTLKFSAVDTFAQTAALSFDISVWQYLGALMKGGCVAIFSDETVLDPLLFLQALTRHQVSVLQTVPVQLQQLMDEVAAGAYDSLGDLRHLIPTGEALPPEMARRWFKRYPHIPMMNAYGPAECSDDVTLHVMKETPAAFYAQLPIGKPVYQSAIYLLDADLLPVPQGAVGEICVAGEVVLGRGYLNAPSLTANAFVANPFGEPGSRLYKTGDLGRYNHLGELEFLGRRDFQIKIRGMRIEMGEIESVMEQASETKRCVVSVENGVLIAYLESRAELAELKRHAAAWLPDFMVPTHYILMAQIPVTANGKVDRKSLPNLAEAGIDERGEAPQPGLESELAAHMATLLKIDVDRIGRLSDFFQLGGHSLLAMRLISTLRRVLEVGNALTVKDLFEQPSPQALAQYITQLQPEARAQISHHELMPLQHFPLSAIQQQMVWFETLQPGTPLYNMPTLWRVHGHLDEAQLNLAMEQLQQQHPMLRARVQLAQQQQYISDDIQALELKTFDTDAALMTWCRDRAEQSFDFAASLFVPYLLRSKQGEQVLMLMMHHVITDAWSSQLLLDDLRVLLSGEAVQNPSAITFSDVVHWQLSDSYQQQLAEQLNWWQETLGDATTVLSLPTPHRRPQQRSFVGYSIAFTLDDATSLGLSKLAQQQDASLFMVLLAAYNAYLSRLTGQQDLIVGVPVSGREHSELERVVGLFVNTLPLRSQCQHQAAFTDYLAQVKSQWLGVLAHQDVPFEHLVDALEQERIAGVNPLVQTLFTLDQQGGGAELETVQFSELEMSHDTAKFDLLLAMAEREGQVFGEFEFALDVFPKALGDQLVNGFIHFLGELVLAQSAPIASLSLVSAAQTEQLMALGQADFEAQAEPSDLVSGFAHVVAEHGERIAVKQQDSALSYRQLDEQANQLAHYLIEQGVQQNTLVAIAMSRSVDWIINALAIIKAGAGYVPLDPAWPQERIDFVAEQAAMQLVFVDKHSKATLSSNQLTSIDSRDLALTHYSTLAPFKSVSSETVAHVIYTSGSTGKPKGVITPHRGISRLVLNPEQGELTQNNVVSFMNNPAFDGASFEIWSALLSGACLAVISHSQVLSPADFGQALANYGVDYGFMTVALFNQYVQTDPTILHHYRVLWTGGEVIPIRYCRDLLASGYQGQLCSAYGPTENTIFSTTFALTPSVLAGQDVPLGRACAWSYHLVMDDHGSLLPLGVPGELYLGGAGVAHGYLNRPDLTEQAFVFTPYSEEKLYRSGDRVSQDSDGVLHFIGRTDNQVKIRGHRIEPEELQVRVNQHDAVELSYVQVRQDEEQVYLAAYVQLKPGHALTRQSLQQWLSDKVAHYLLPSTITFVERFKLNANGKIDSKVLPTPSAEDWGQLASSGVLEGQAAQLADIWQELLGKQPSLQDSFFTLGGNSLLAMQLVNRVKDEFDIELPIAEVFLKQRLGDQLALLQQAQNDGAAGQQERIQAAAIDAIHPLSFAQERLWFLHDMEPESLAYHLPLAYRMRGKVRLDALSKAIELVANRHVVLKSRVVLDNEQAYQQADPSAKVPFNLHYCAEDELEAMMAKVSATPFDLRQGPVFRADVFMLDSEDLALLINVHHAMADGWSLAIIADELRQAYRAYCDQQTPELPVLSCQYGDFAQWQRSHFDDHAFTAQLDYWRDTLADAPDLQLYTDRPRTQTRSEAGATYSCLLPQSLVTTLNSYERQGYSGFMVMMATFATVLRRYSGQDDIVIGTPVAGRATTQLEQLVGFFVNMLPLRLQFDAQQSFEQLLVLVQRQLAAAMANQQVPFERIVQEVVKVRDTSRTPVFQAVLSYQDLAYDGLELDGLEVSAIDPQLDVAKYDLLLNVTPQSEGTWLTMEYSSALFDESTIADMMSNFTAILARMLAQPTAQLDSLPLLSDEVASKVCELYQRPRQDFMCDETTHARFERIAAQYPQHIAIVCEGQSIRYQMLNQHANRIAWQLIERGVTAGSLVGVCVDRSINMLIAILGVMKAGGAYVPLDPTHPQQRIDYIVNDADLTLVIGDTQYSGQFSTVEYLDTAMTMMSSHNSDNPPVRCQPEDLTYVIYTSGSTGTPKGVLLEHRNVVRLFDATATRIPITENDVWSLFSSCTFDFSVWEIWGALLHGGKLVVVPYETTRNSEAFHQLLCEQGVTQLSQTPSAFLQVVRENLQSSQQLPVRRVVLGGEEIDFTALRGWFERYQDEIEIINMYGITEITVHATHRRIQASDVLEQTATASLIGDGIADLDILILDEHQHLVPVGVAGEIYVAGAGLARGYLNLPEQTADRFITVNGDRLYRSGDLARVTVDGDLEYLGRCDNQVKIRGFRIELGEIEALLSDMSGVDEALVMAHKEPQGGTALVAYIMDSQGRASEQQLRAALQQRLPEYMVPAYFVMMEAFPLTANGKVDRRALPEPKAALQARVGELPQTNSEQFVAQVFAELLDLEVVYRDDNFFEIGGHSLLATRVISRLQKQFNYKIAMRDFFQMATVRELAALVGPDEPLTQEKTELAELPQVERKAATLMQQSFWIAQSLLGDKSAYNMPLALLIDGTYDLARIEHAVTALWQGHKALRVYLKQDTQGLWQHAREATAPAPFEVINLGPNESLIEHAQQLGAEPFSFDGDTLFKVVLLTKGAQACLQFVVSHLIADGWSLTILAEEFMALYQAKNTTMISGSDYWQYQALPQTQLEEGLDWWRGHLAAAPQSHQLSLQMERELSRQQGARREVVLTQDVTDDLTQLAQSQGMSSFMLLLAAWQLVQHKFTGETDLVTGFPVSGRDDVAFERTVGLFVNTLPLRGQLDPQQTLQQFLSQVRDSAFDALDHQTIPLSQIVEAVAPNRLAGMNPLFQITFSLHNLPSDSVTLDGLTITPVESEPESVKLDLCWFVQHSDDGMVIQLEYDVDLFEAGLIDSLIGSYEYALTQLSSWLAMPINELSVVSPKQQQKLSHWSQVDGQWPQTATLHGEFERRAEAYPDAVAVEVLNGTSLTYCMLDEKANGLARVLLARGVQVGSRVALCLPRNELSVIAALAVLKAGAAYIGLDPELPAERRDYILSDSDADLLLCTQETAQSVQGEYLFLDDFEHIIASIERTNPQIKVRCDQLAYVIYTSGTTGRPKGTLLQHSAVMGFARNSDNLLDIQVGTRVLQFASIAFDSAVLEFWAALMNGATLLLADKMAVMPGIALAQTLETMQVNFAILFPSVLANTPVHAYPALHTILTAGEAPSYALLQSWSAPTRRIINAYGPSETGVGVSLGDFDISRNRKPHMGVPRPGSKLFVLDDQLQPVPPGAVGTLYIGGPCVGLGYWRKPDVTDARFTTHPSHGRLYNSGDLVRYDGDGNLVFIGRADNQIKLRGHRVELEEVEAVLCNFAEVSQAAVVPQYEGETVTALAAYIVTTAPAAQVKAQLQSLVPSYMVPQLWCELAALPTDVNGKIKRSALPAAEVVSSGPRQQASGQVQQTLMTLWQEILGHSDFGVTDNFFDVGGQSILATRLQAAINQAFEKEVELLALFKHTTISAQASCLSDETVAAKPKLGSQAGNKRRQARQRQRRGKETC